MKMFIDKKKRESQIENLECDIRENRQNPIVAHRNSEQNERNDSNPVPSLDYTEPPHLIIWALFIGVLAGFLGGLLGRRVVL